ncbi:MAG TPA: hypothetical protein VIL01_16470 [Thermomicrobiales bacterium]
MNILRTLRAYWRALTSNYPAAPQRDQPAHLRVVAGTVPVQRQREQQSALWIEGDARSMALRRWRWQ